MKNMNLKYIVFGALFLAIIPKSGLAAWTETGLILPQFINDNPASKVTKIEITSINHSFWLNIETKPTEVASLRDHTSRSGFQFDDQTPEFANVPPFSHQVSIKIPFSQPDRAKGLIDEISRFETIDSESLAKMKKKVDKVLADGEIDRLGLSSMNLLGDSYWNRVLEEVSAPLIGAPTAAPIIPQSMLMGSGFLGGGLMGGGLMGGGLMGGGFMGGGIMSMMTGAQQLVGGHMGHMGMMSQMAGQTTTAHANSIAPRAIAGQKLKANQYQTVKRDDLTAEDLAVTCSLCLTKLDELLNTGSEAVRVNCAGRHLFCKDCIEEIPLRNTCPNCRGDITEKVDEKSPEKDTASK